MSKQTLKSIIETEFKWQVKNESDFDRFLPVIKEFKISRFVKIEITDTYLDSQTLALKKQNTAIRIRKVKNNFELTVKQANKIKKGLALRKEQSIKLPQEKSLKSILKIVNAGGFSLEKLRPVFKIVNNRKTTLLVYGKTKMQLCFDDVKIFAAGKKRAMKEIELEFIEGRKTDFEKFTNQITRQTGLKPAKISKVRTAYKILR